MRSPERSRRLDRSSHRAIERLFLFGGQRTSCALWQITEQERANPDAHQTKHFDLQRFEHPADVTILAFIQHYLKPRIAPTVTKCADCFYAQELALARANSDAQCLQ